MRTHSKIFLSASLLTLALSGCAAEGTASAGIESNRPAGSPAGRVIGDGHGAIQGAREEPEPQLHIVTIDPAGSIEMLDLADEARRAAGSVPNVTSIATDGRYVFASSADDGTMTVVDSGVWTMDHEDHFHYYSSEPRTVGTVKGEGEAVVSAGTTTTGVFFPATGERTLLDNKALADGELRATAKLAGQPHEGMLVPLAEYALATAPGTDGKAARVDVYDAGGELVDGVGAECIDAKGTIKTPAGTVIGCADGALLATVADGSVTFERIPYPAGTTAGKAVEFRAREGRPTVAAVAGDKGAWLLDTRNRSWQLIETEVPLLQVSAVDDKQGHVVALTEDGRVLVLSAKTGAVLSSTEPLLPETLANPDLLDGVELVADQRRAYLNAPAERQLHEIDFADDARLARSFKTHSVPAFLAETGR